jgi:hypothetical protein
MAILAFLLLAFLSLMSSANATSANSKESAIAINILQATMEDSFALTYAAFWNQYFANSNLFPAVYSDPSLQSSLPSIVALAPRVQGASPPLTASENTTWWGIVNQFKTHRYPLTGTGRLRNESINLYLMPTSDIYTGASFKTSMNALDHNYVEYMVEITWTDAGGKPRRESITTRRSQ